MEISRYCVYNETNECFLSLGVILGNSTSAQLKSIFRPGSFSFLEGCWITRPQGLETVGLLDSRDLVYIDGTQRVVHVRESFPRFRVAPSHPNAASLLALPVSTIESSQTQVGDQLAICVAQEMEIRLRGIQHPSDSLDFRPAEMPSARKSRLFHPTEKDRSPRRRWPRLEGYPAEGKSIVPQAVRDISNSGLFLMTDERWPLGTRVRISLQRTDGLDDSSMIPTTVELRVSRWGADGVGFEFVTEDAEQLALVSTHVR